MITYEDFKKVWKDSSRESILNQFYYEHNELFRIQKEVREYIEYYGITPEQNDDVMVRHILKVILEILDRSEK